MTIDEIIFFYKSFNKYKNYNYNELYNFLYPSYQFKQFKIFKNKEIYGFVNWAFVNENAKNFYLQSGILKNWNCGKEIIHIDLLAKKNVKEIYLWSRKNLAKNLSINSNTSWLRLKNNKIRNKVTKKIRNNRLWVE